MTDLGNDDDNDFATARRWFNAWRYTWGALVNIFNVSVVLYVFDAIGTRDTRIIVAVLGLMFCTSANRAIFNYLWLVDAGLRYSRELDSIRLHVDPDHVSQSPELDRTERLDLRPIKVRCYINLGGTLIISLICLWQLFGGLSQWRGP